MRLSSGGSVAVADWMDAQSADGVKLAEWVEAVVAREYPGKPFTAVVGPTTTRALQNWRAGSAVDFFIADRVITLLRHHPSELPNDVWRSEQAIGQGQRLRAARRCKTREPVGVANAAPNS